MIGIIIYIVDQEVTKPIIAMKVYPVNQYCVSLKKENSDKLIIKLLGIDSFNLPIHLPTPLHWTTGNHQLLFIKIHNRNGFPTI